MTPRLVLVPAVRTVVAFLVALFLVTFPLYGTDFQVIQIGAQSLFLGIVALSLAFLAGYGGMVSLAQTAVYGVAGYAFGILAVSHPSPGLGVGPFVVTHAYPWWVGAIGGLVATTVVAFLFGLISVRTRGIYFLMITLALSMIVYNFAEENYTILNGHGGIGGEQAPRLAGISFGDPKPFYYLCLVVAALLYFGLTYLVRTPFGLALQGVRDNARRMRALGYWPEAHRVAAFTLGGFIAGVGGILGVWYYRALTRTAFNTPTGPVRLDQNRNAIANEFINEVAKNGTLYNKLVRVVPNVNETLGLPRAQYLKYGEFNRNNPSCP